MSTEGTAATRPRSKVHPRRGNSGDGGGAGRCSDHDDCRRRGCARAGQADRFAYADGHIRLGKRTDNKFRW